MFWMCMGWLYLCVCLMVLSARVNWVVATWYVYPGHQITIKLGTPFPNSLILWNHLEGSHVVDTSSKTSDACSPKMQVQRYIPPSAEILHHAELTSFSGSIVPVVLSKLPVFAVMCHRARLLLWEAAIFDWPQQGPDTSGQISHLLSNWVSHAAVSLLQQR